MGRACKIFLWVAGVTCFIVGVVLDWINFEELRQNDIDLEATGNKACDFALDKYHWIFMASVIIKMLSGILEYYFGLKSLDTEDETRNKYDILSLIFNIITSTCQAADLLLLVLFSYHCLDNERRHHVLRFLGDDKDDALAGALGTVGIIFNLTIKRNILTILQSLCSPCTKHEHGPLKWLSFFSLLLIFTCVGLAIALVLKLDL